MAFGVSRTIRKYRSRPKAKPKRTYRPSRGYKPRTSRRAANRMVRSGRATPKRRATAQRGASRRTRSRITTRAQNTVAQQIINRYINPRGRRKAGTSAKELKRATTVGVQATKAVKEAPSVKDARQTLRKIQRRGYRKVGTQRRHDAQVSRQIHSLPSFKQSTRPDRGAKMVRKGIGKKFRPVGAVAGHAKGVSRGPSLVERQAAAIGGGIISHGQQQKVIPKSKTTGQKISQKVAEWGPVLAPGGKAGMGLLRGTVLSTRGATAGGFKVGGRLGLRGGERKLTQRELQTKAGKALQGATPARAAAKRQATRQAEAQAGRTSAAIRAGVRRVGASSQRRGERRLLKQAARQASKTPRTAGQRAAHSIYFPAAAGNVPVVRGHAKAIGRRPGMVAKTTARTIPSLVAYPFTVGANVGLSGYRAGRSGLKVAGLPGGKSYSIGNIVKPVETVGKETFEFTADFAKTMTSSDVNKIAWDVEHKYGLTAPIVVGIPGAKVAGKALKPAYKRIAPPGMQRKVSDFRGKRDVAVDAAFYEALGMRGAKRAADPVVRNLQKSKAGWEARDAFRYIVRHGIARGRNGYYDVRREHMGKTRPEKAPAASKVEYDAKEYLVDHPELFDNKHFWRAVDEYKKQAGEITTSPRAQHMAQALDFGVDFPERTLVREHRVAQERLLGIPKDKATRAKKQATTAAAAVRRGRKTLDDRLRKLETKPQSKKAKREAMEARGRYDQRKRDAKQSRSDLAKAERGHREAQEALKHAKKLERMVEQGSPKGKPPTIPLTAAERAAVHEGLPPKASSAVRKRAYQEAKHAKNERLYEAAMDQFLTKMEEGRVATGREMPAWASDVSVMTNPLGPSPRSPKRGSSAPKYSRGVLQRQGIVSQDFQTLLGRSIVEPRMRQAMHENTTRFVTDSTEKVQIGGRKSEIVDGRNIAEALEQLPGKEADYVALPLAQFKQAVLDETVPLEAPVAELRAAMGVRIRDLAGEGGRKYALVRRAKAEEWIKQLEVPEIGGLQKLQHASTRVILGYSPAWVILQPLAEGIPGLLAVGPQHQVPGYRGLRKAEQQFGREMDGFMSLAGESNYLVESPKQAQRNLVKDTEGALAGMRRTEIGRDMIDLTTGQLARRVDSWKGGEIRKSVAAGAVHRQFHSFLGAQSNFLKLSEQVTAEMKGLSFPEQLRYVSTHREVAKKLESYLDNVMGNWRAMTHRERGISKFAIFYPFLRYSLRWTFWSFPKTHPIKASILQFLAQQNAEQVSNLNHGDPTFWQMYATAPVYGGEDGEITAGVSLTRMLPGANAIVQAIGTSGKPSSFLGVLNPALSIPATSLLGVDPLSGKSLAPLYQSANFKQAAALALTQLLNMPAPLRVGLSYLPEVQKGDWPIFGKEYQRSPEGLLVQKIMESRSSRAWQSFALPLKPHYAQRTRVLNLIDDLRSRKYGSPAFNDKTAFDQVQAVMDGKLSREQLLRNYWDGRRADDRLRALEIHYGIDPSPHSRADTKRFGKLMRLATGKLVIPVEDQKTQKDIRKRQQQATRGAVRRTAAGKAWEFTKGFLSTSRGRKLKTSTAEISQAAAVLRRRNPKMSARGARMTAGEMTPRMRRQFLSQSTRQDARGIKADIRGAKKVLGSHPWTNVGHYFSAQAKQARKTSQAEDRRVAKAFKQDIRQAKKVFGSGPFKSIGKIGSQFNQQRKKAIRQEKSNVAAANTLIGLVTGLGKKQSKVAAKSLTPAQRKKFMQGLLTQAGGKNKGKGTPIPRNIPNPKAKPYLHLVAQAAKKYNVPASFLASLFDHESARSWSTTIGSSAGAFGISQFMPGTATAYGVKRGDARSQIFGAAAKLSADGWKTGNAAAIHKAMDAYSGGYPHSQYNDPILNDAKTKWKFMDKVAGGASIAAAPRRLTPKQIQTRSAQKLFKSGFKGKNLAKVMAKLTPQQKKKLATGQIAVEKASAGGPWAGSERVVMTALKQLGFAKLVTSQKRATKSTASGGISDHWTGATKNFAADVGASSKAAGDKIATAWAKKMGIKNYTHGNNWVSYSSPKAPGYRIQIGWQVSGHYDHVHIGAAYVGPGNAPKKRKGGASFVIVPKTQAAPSGGTTSGGIVAPSGGTSGASAPSGRSAGAKRTQAPQTAAQAASQPMGFQPSAMDLLNFIRSSNRPRAAMGLLSGQQSGEFNFGATGQGTDADMDLAEQIISASIGTRKMKRKSRA